MEKRPADSENGDSNGAENGAKKAKLDPDCGRLLFCGSTDWEFHQKPAKLKEESYYSKNNFYEPHFIKQLKDVRIRHVSSNQDATHLIVVDDEGTAWSWGNNEYGQLGQGDKKHRRIPTKIPGTGPTGHIIVALATSKKHSLMLTSRGDVLACGDNKDGQCAQGEMKSKHVEVAKGRKEEIEISSITEVLEPTQINYSGPPIIKISTGMDFSMLLDVEGCAWTFGSQEFGQCGNGTDGSYNSQEAKVKMRYAGISTPHQILRVYERDSKTKKTKTLNKMRIKDIAAGTHHAGMVDEMGRVFTWGAGSYGRTGLNDPMDTHVPTWVQSLDHPRGKIDEIFAGNLCTILLAKGNKQAHMAGIVDAARGEANTTPKQYFDFGEAAYKNIGFFRKGWNFIGEDGSVMQTNAGPCFGELGTGDKFRNQGVPKKSKEFKFAKILKCGTGVAHCVYIIADTTEEQIEELDEYDDIEQDAIEYKE